MSYRGVIKRLMVIPKHGGTCVPVRIHTKWRGGCYPGGDPVGDGEPRIFVFSREFKVVTLPSILDP